MEHAGTKIGHFSSLYQHVKGVVPERDGTSLRHHFCYPGATPGSLQDIRLMPEPLTDLTLRKVLPRGSSRREIWDTKVPGFGVRVSPSRSKSFVLVYRHKGRPRRMTLGKYPIMGLAKARDWAIQALRDAKDGVDPQTEKIIAQTGTRFDETVDLFVSTYCTQNNRDSTRREKERLLKSRFVRRWGARDLREITKADVNSVLDATIAEGLPSAANHALADI